MVSTDYYMNIDTGNILIFSNVFSLGWRIVFTCVITIIINLPFGYVRGRFRKLSFWWFVAIHAPVPLIIFIRKFFGLSLTWKLAPFLLGSFFLGQYLGRRIHTAYPPRKKKKAAPK